MKTRIVILILFTLITFSMCKNKNIERAPLTIEINYGENSRTINTPWEEGLTALEALQHVATIETHPVNEYVFVTSIDSVKGIRGIKGWYYKVNSKSPEKLAINQLVNAGDTITWIFKEDVCSGKVNGSKCAK